MALNIRFAAAENVDALVDLTLQAFGDSGDVACSLPGIPGTQYQTLWSASSIFRGLNTQLYDRIRRLSSVSPEPLIPGFMHAADVTRTSSYCIQFALQSSYQYIGFAVLVLEEL